MHSNNKIFIAGSLANGACFSMILPLLAPFTRQLGLTELQGGALVSASALVMAVSALFLSKQKQILNIYQLLSVGFIGMAITWGLFAAVLSYGMSYAIPFTALFGLLILTRASTGFFMAMPQIALQSYVMATFETEQERRQHMAKFGACNSLGIVIGPLATTLLLFYHLLLPLWIAVIILVSVTLWIIWGYQHKQGAHQVKYSQPQPHHEPAQKLQWSKLKLWFFLGMSLYTAIITLNLTAGFYIQDQFHVTPEQSALYFSQCSLIVGISLVLMQMALSKWLNWSISTLLWIGLGTMMIGLLTSLMASQMWIFQTAYLFYGIAVACLLLAFTTGAAQSVSADLQTQVASWCAAVQALSFVGAPLLSTGLYQLNRYLPYCFLLVLMICAVVYLLLREIKPNQSHGMV